jgi:hypothetical protein
MIFKRYLVKYCLVDDVYMKVNCIELYALDKKSAENIVKFTFKEAMKSIILKSCELI